MPRSPFFLVPRFRQERRMPADSAPPPRVSAAPRSPGRPGAARDRASLATGPVDVIDLTTPGPIAHADSTSGAHPGPPRGLSDSASRAVRMALLPHGGSGTATT
eukprot:3962469-Prymnesium_polylepis.1